MTISPEEWDSKAADETYGVSRWGAGYFGIGPDGDVVIHPDGPDQPRKVGMMEIVSGLKERGIQMPVLLRFGDILNARMDLLHQSFSEAIKQLGYQGDFRGVYPIKVNQQQQIVEEIVRYGERYHHGLEAGSKAELIAALAHMTDPESYIVCNGYKDEEFVNLALYGLKMGFQVILVVEMPSELDLILECAEQQGLRPFLGMRAKLRTRAESHWAHSSGDDGMFGMNAPDIVDVVDRLKEADALDCLRMLHFHLGSQISNIISVRQAIAEVSRIYADLVREGAPMGILDVGGGLAVDYDGTHSSSANSCNYGLSEYAIDVVENIMRVLDRSGVPHPVIVTESGRATVAHHSVLLFNILEVSRSEASLDAEISVEGMHELVQNLYEVKQVLTEENTQECFNDLLYYREEIRSRFDHADITLREWALGERLAVDILGRIATLMADEDYVPEGMKKLRAEIADVYHGNFSVFQSLPDAWAINQMFPVMPLHRLNEAPTRRGTLADITCDCDGRIDQFMERMEPRRSLALHELNGEDYYLGVFLVGAYQETLGDLHNLLGDTHVVGISVSSDGKVEYDREIEGDSVGDVLSYVEYRPSELIDRMKRLAECAVRAGHISPTERRAIVHAFQEGLRGYTYFES